MIARLITMFAILAITVVTTVTSVHAAGMSMSAGQDHAMHVGEMMHAQDSADLACDGEQHWGSVEAEMCVFVCVGLSAFMTLPDEAAGHTRRSAEHDIRSEPIQISCPPGQAERPPKHRLL